MKMVLSKKSVKKKKPSKYDEVFKIDATFDEVLQTAFKTNVRDLKSYKEIQKMKTAKG
jgi:hypothetical protein